jgi:hypothetical protein
MTLQIILLHGIVLAIQAFRGEADLFLLLYFMILCYGYGLCPMLQYHGCSVQVWARYVTDMSRVGMNLVSKPKI